ncbi:MAG: Gfo/Idh/MocA family oxidoreductase [Sphaerochaetaceae bacterium]|jgi:predicted dehydrogenase|nr:Gfo/Idh/MocA family oxidoreductase [Sphaerochaetaceae bacterium]NLO60243.1 Gfo/Idh/MocA family oxidoreductase [Spirochaetales bacterium]MDD2405622.1 Gfo/Idh/MocA family oxidoreductase [Sphaerochaetaceae bacterium]MDD4259978.1 Gfo/Idh/MocA family oxidoreductase [Sphaerochaetaceae bacterium]MDD4764146.1 Gfo/Idh/MocA family oxidoreductase [Sphaerochaetaceae bacterium]
MEKVKWGILGAAKIAQFRIVPALHRSTYCELVAVASRNQQKADEFAKNNNIPVAYGSYEQLLDDPLIQAVYIPLPNHLHVEWIEKAVKKGKHVLCEKPLALSVSDVERLIALRDSTGLLIGEAYAMLHQPRLHQLKRLFTTGELGKLDSAHGCFYLYNRDKNNVRNKYEKGGGSLWDIGVYPIATGRWMFGEEPVEVSCTMEIDEQFNVDYHVTGWLRFPSGSHMSFVCGMRYPDHTHMSFYTENHRLEVPSTYFSDNETQNVIQTYKGLTPAKTYEFEVVDQYSFECDNFVLAMQKKQPFQGSLEHTLAQTKVLLALFESAKLKKVVEL